MTVSRRPHGSYAICWPAPGPFLVLSRKQLRELLIALDGAGLIVLDADSSSVTIL